MSVQIEGRGRLRAAGAAPAASLARDSGLLGLFAVLGAGALAFVAWCWLRWIASDNFRPVDPGPDALPAWQSVALNVLQPLGLLAALWLLWRYTIRPRIRTGRFTSDGLVCLALPTIWFQDLMFGYSQTWMAYNAHLWNMGSWAAQIPGWLGRHPQQMLEPLVTFYGYIFWMFACMLLICAVMRAFATRFPKASHASVFAFGLAFTVLLDLIVETLAIRIGWYAVPGAWRAMSLFAGTPHQVPLHEVLFGGIQSMAFAAILFYRDDRGHSFVERGVERIKAARGVQTLLRFLALTGALHLFFFVTYSLPCMWMAQHGDPWVDGMPSYFTAMCPEYATARSACGGRGIAIHRPDYIWLPED